MKNKKITIIIVTYNSRTKIPECFESIRHQNYPKNLIKVIIVDNASADSTIGYIKEKYPEFKVVENGKNYGFAKANNQGYFLAQKNGSDYIYLLNDDAVLEPNALGQLVKTAEGGRKIAAVQAKLLLHPRKELINSFGNSLHYLGFAYCNKYKEEDRQSETEPFEVPYSSGAAVLIKMSALRKIGLFNEQFFMYHEDVDFGWRLRLAGYQVIFDPLAVVYHKYLYSKAKYKFYYMERNRWIVLLQNYRILTLVLLAPALLIMEIGQLLYSLKNGWFREKIKGWLWVLGHIFSILGHRLDNQFKIRKTKDREILRLMVGSIRFQEVKYPFLTYVVNPLMEAYFWLVKLVIFW